MAFTLRLSEDMEEQIALVQKKYDLSKSDTIKLLLIKGLSSEEKHPVQPWLINQNK